jgi:hypothetical protein
METREAPPTTPDHATEVELAFLREYLSARSIACPMCTYELRGLTSDRCPECGERLVLQVGAAEPRLGSWVAGLIGIAGGAGFHAVLFGWAIIARMSTRWGPPLGEVIVIAALASVQALGVFLWVRLGRRIRRASRGARSALVMTGWGVSIALVIVTFYVID